MGIRIITDNCCDLPDELVRAYNIVLVPLKVRFGDECIEPGSMDNAAFYDRMKISPDLPATTQPGVGDFLSEYQKAREAGEEVISIHLSSGISGTVQAATIAAGMVEGAHINVFDSRKASVGQGLMVIEAARRAEAGQRPASILQRLEEMREHLECVFVVGNLEALIKGGRISRSKAKLADILDIKPVLHMDEEGKIVPYAKARSRNGARNKLIDIMGQMGSDYRKQTIGLCHSACLEDAVYLEGNIREKYGVKEIITGEIGPVIGSHVGQGTFSVFFEAQKPVKG